MGPDETPLLPSQGSGSGLCAVLPAVPPSPAATFPLLTVFTPWPVSSWGVFFQLLCIKQSRGCLADSVLYQLTNNLVKAEKMSDFLFKHSPAR